MQPSNRADMNSQPEHVQARDAVTGDALQALYESVVEKKRDLYASYIGHDSTLAYMAIAANESIGRMRSNMMHNLAQAGRTDMATIAAELAEAILNDTSTDFGIETSEISESDIIESDATFKPIQSKARMVTEVAEIILIDSETESVTEVQNNISASDTIVSDATSQLMQSRNYATADTFKFDQEELINPGTAESTTEPCHYNIPDTYNSEPDTSECIPVQSIPYQKEPASYVETSLEPVSYVQISSSEED